MHTFLLLDNLQSDILQNLVLGVASAPFYIQQSAAWLAKRYCSLLPPKSFLLSLSLRRLISVFKLPAGLLFILTAMSTLERRAPAAQLLTIFGSVGFRMRFVFSSLSEPWCIHQGRYVAPVYYACGAASCEVLF